jgi:hypothetical protein
VALTQSNTTCDVYRNGNAPPAAPDVAGVKCLLTPDFANGHTAALQNTTTLRWTHVLLVGPGVDVRDGYTVSNVTFGEEGVDGTVNDFVYVPNKNGTKFGVIFVERVGLGTGGDVKRVYLQRYQPAWPTNNL